MRSDWGPFRVCDTFFFQRESVLCAWRGRLIAKAMLSFLLPVSCTLLTQTTKVPGDIGFDPLNLKSINPPLLATKSQDPLTRYREAELKHGRIAMLASIAYPFQERYHAGLATTWNLPNLLEATNGLSPSLVNGGISQEPLPVFFSVVIALASIAELGALKFADKRVPGDLGISRRINANTLYIMQSGEVWNSRLAMVGVLACVLFEGVTKVPVIDVIRP